MLKVHVKKRIGPDDYIKSMQSALAKHYGNKIVGKVTKVDTFYICIILIIL